jgi:acyl-CoA-binding protein
VRLQLYALYKQATVGDAPVAAPTTSVLDPTGTIKWRSWSNIRGMETAAAMEEYVRAVRTATGDGAGAAAEPPLESTSDDGATIDGIPLEVLDSAMDGFAGPVMSALSVTREEEEEVAAADRRTPLHAAARKGDARRCEELLARGEPVDRLDEDEHTALHWACDGGWLEAVRVLLASTAHGVHLRAAARRTAPPRVRRVGQRA